MESKKTVLAASYPSRIFENDVTINSPGCMVLCPDLSINVATGSKNKETTASLFFSRRQRSKVIFRVTQNSLRILLNYFRKYLALAGGCDHAEDKSGTLKIYHPLQNQLTLVVCFEVTWQPAAFAPDGRKRSGLQSKPALHLPVVASVTARPGTGMHPDFHKLRQDGYGK